MVMAGDIQFSEARYLIARAVMLSQKLFVVKTHADKAGMAMIPPTRQTSAFVIRFFFSYLSLTRPPITVERNPQLATISAL